MENSSPYRMLKLATLTTAAVTLGFTMNLHAADFAPVKTLTVGNDPSSLASGDLNGDGIPDLVVANYTDGTVSVLLGSAGNLGNFDPPTTIVVGSTNRQPWGVAIGNVVGDANPDIVVAASGDNEITILPGNGSGSTFGTPIQVPTGSSPQDVILGDVDNDGDLDLIAANFGDGTVTVQLKDNGLDSFTEATNSPFAAGTQPYSLVFADATGDSVPDIVLVNLNADTVSVLNGSNDANFSAPTPYATGAKPFGVAVADLDGVNGPDLAVANANSDSVSVLLNDGAGGFAKVDTPLAVNSGPHGIAIADVGDDGKLDLVVTNTDDSTIDVLEGDGSGSFASVTNTFPAGTNPRPLVLADFDGDGHLDIASTNTNSGSTSALVLINDNKPVATDDAFNIINGSTSVALDVLANDSDPDTGDTLSISSAGPGDQGGTILVNANNDGIDYTPASQNVTESFSYTVEDQFGYASTATVTATVGANQPPVPTAPSITTSEDTNGTSQIVPNDPDAGDTFTYAVTGQGTNGSASVSASGLVTYTPSLNFSGSDSVTVTVTDSGSLSAPVTIGVTVNPQNDPPAPTAPSITTNEGTSGTSQITPNDPDAGDTFTYAVTGQGANGSASVSANGLVTYTPSLNFSGSDSVTVTVTDSGSLSAPVTIGVTVNAQNAPNAPPVTIGSIADQSATEGTAFGPLDVAANFNDPDSTLTYSLSGLPAGTGLAIDPNTGVISGTPTAADANASQPITVTVSATDGSTPASQQFALTVSASNTPPVDSDGDGVSDSLEDPAYMFDASIADGLPLDNGATVQIVDAGQTLSNVSAAPASAAPAGISVPFGTISYTTTSAVGGSVTVRMIFSADLPDNMALYKVDNSGTYTELSSSLWTKVSATTVDVTLTDGDPATDLDGSANGSIEDPIAVTSESTSSNSSNGSSQGFGGCTLSTSDTARKDPLMPALVMTAIIALYRRNRRSSKH